MKLLKACGFRQKLLKFEKHLSCFLNGVTAKKKLPTLKKFATWVPRNVATKLYCRTTEIDVHNWKCYMIGLTSPTAASSLLHWWNQHCPHGLASSPGTTQIATQTSKPSLRHDLNCWIRNSALRTARLCLWMGRNFAWSTRAPTSSWSPTWF